MKICPLEFENSGRFPGVSYQIHTRHEKRASFRRRNVPLKVLLIEQTYACREKLLHFASERRLFLMPGVFNTRKPLQCAMNFLLCVSLLFALPLISLGGPQTQAGPYHVELTTETGKVPTTGRAKLLLKITDSSGKPLEGVKIRALTKMPGMSMGEREETALPVTGQPGTYTAPAQFAMEGGYEAALKIDGPQGSAVATVSLNTGQETGSLSSGATGSGSSGSGSENSGFSPISALPYLVVLLIGGFVIVKMRQTGQGFNLRGVFNRSVIGGLLLLGLIGWGAVYAVTHNRRSGAITPIQAQAMDMNLPAPTGTAPVELATVTRGKIENTVRYTGQAVGNVEQDIAPRVTGVITWMPFYAGDKVKRGQLIARLDTSQSAPQVAGQRASLAMAAQGTEVARRDYEQARAQVNEAHAELGMERGALQATRADLTAAQRERDGAQANLEAAQSMTADADAQLSAAQADQKYWREEINREASLLKAGAVTREEYQRESAQAENADAKARQAQARIAQVEAQIRAAQSILSKADAGIASANAKITQSQSALDSHEAHILSTNAMVNSAKQKIAQAKAGEAQARAVLSGADATKAYSEIRAETDGVVTQRVISPGVLVNPGQTLLKIAQIAPIRLQANVSETDLPHIKAGSRVQVSGQNANDKPVTAQITSIAPSVDPAARTGIVEAIIANRDSKFLPGQYVTMDISTGQSANALRIPTRALRYHTAPSGGILSAQSTATVWTAEPTEGQNGQYTVREVTVKIGLSDGQNTEILSGLNEGQKVVLAGQNYLKNGDSVTVAGSLQTAAAETPKVAAMDAPPPSKTVPVSAAKSKTSKTLYTCLMHPEVVQDHPGDCPKCRMKLVAKQTGGAK